MSLASLYLLALPSFAEAILGFVSDIMDNVRLGSLYSALAIMFVPVALLGVYSPFAIRLVLRTAQRSGTVSGVVYGVSTAGSIAGKPGTTFFLVPVLGTRAITLLLGAVGVGCGTCLMALDRLYAQRKAAKSIMGLFVFAVLVLACNRAWPRDLLDESVRARMLKHADGRIAHLETEYNNLYIDKGDRCCPSRPGSGTRLIFIQSSILPTRTQCRSLTPEPCRPRCSTRRQSNTF